MSAEPDPIAGLLARQGVVVLDGGLATELEARGFDLGDELWSARILVDSPDAIRRVHLDYLVSGADVIVSASYQATIEGFARRGRSRDEAEELIRSAVRLACDARDEFWSSPILRAARVRPLVAASVGPYGATLADGAEYRGDYGLRERDLVEFHRERFALLAESEADLLAIETIPASIEARALVRLLHEHPRRFAWISFTCRDGSRISDGGELAEIAAELDRESQLAAIGVNCTAPQHVAELVGRLREVTGKPIVVYPNAGESWDAANRCWVPEGTRPDFGAAARAWHGAGASLIGGCCRTGPDDVAAIRRALAPPRVPRP